MRKFIRKQLIKKGYDIIKLSQFNAWPADFEDSHRKIIEKSGALYNDKQGERIWIDRSSKIPVKKPNHRRCS